ncbi:MAG: hypothetical protein WCG27_02495, partial [Pseudomonadota bacterium]
NYHFTTVAYNKEVESVRAHIGVVQQKGTDKPYWDSVKDLDLERKNGHFYAKGELVGSQGGGSGEPPLANLGPVVQYFVKFKDGSTLISETWGIFMDRSFNRFASTDEVDIAVDAFQKSNDASKTSGFRIGQGSGWCY